MFKTAIAKATKLAFIAGDYRMGAKDTTATTTKTAKTATTDTAKGTDFLNIASGITGIGATITNTILGVSSAKTQNALAESQLEADKAQTRLDQAQTEGEILQAQADLKRAEVDLEIARLDHEKAIAATGGTIGKAPVPMGTKIALGAGALFLAKKAKLF